MRRMRPMLWMFVALVLMFAFPVPYGLAAGEPLENAVLKGDWKGVIEILGKDGKKAKDPVARLIMGHACLATNRNNESMLLFLSVKEEKDLKLWQDWTDSFLSDNPQNPVALYLSGDAQARTGKLEEAIKKCTQTLNIQKDFALALSARGVVSVWKDKWDDALIDFLRATRLDPQFADAYVNLGTHYILRSETSEEVKEYFNQALKINPNFALAYNGRGCAYFGLGKFEKADADFEMASQICPALVIAEINQGYNSAYTSETVSLAAMEQKPGVSFESILKQHYEDISKRQHEIMLPLVKDRELLKMSSIEWALLPNDKEKLHSLVSKYGPAKMQMAGFLARQQLMNEMRENHQKMLKTIDKISLHDKIIYRSSMVENWSSFGFSSSGLLKKVATQGWKPLLRQSTWELGKAGAQALAPNRISETIIGAIGDPVSSALSSYPKVFRYISEDTRALHLHTWESLKITDDVGALKLRAIDRTLGLIGASYPSEPSSRLTLPRAPTSVFINPDQSLTDLGNLVHKIDAEIPSLAQQPRQLSIVAGDESRFRSNILQHSFAMRGFITNVIPPENVPKIIGQYPTQAIIGVDKDIPKQTWDNWKFKPFTPIYPKVSPGGISSENIAKAFVDRGDWPILTSFTLGYGSDLKSLVKEK